MELLRNRPRLLVAIAIGLALALGLGGGALATSFLRSGGPVKSVKVATDDSPASTTAATWSDVPGMSATLTVPSGEKALFLVTFSANALCFEIDITDAACYIRAVIDNNEMAPGAVNFSDPKHGYESQSMQWLASPSPSGPHTIKIQFHVSGSSGGIAQFIIHSRTLSVLRSKI